MAPRTRIAAFGSAALVVVVGLLCWLIVGGLTGQVIAIAGTLLGLGGALLLIFLEVGLSEDRALEREEDLRRGREARRDDAQRRLRAPRQALRLGTSAPKRVSMKRRRDVWSNTSELTKPPRLNGEIRSAGTRKPSPIGPRMPCAASGSGFAVTYSPGVPGGGTGGGTWSKKPPFSSQVTNSAVFAHSSGFPVTAVRTSSVVYSPQVTGAGGCSLCVIAPQIHETCGRLPLAQSAWNCAG